jgi:hypothetical protein
VIDITPYSQNDLRWRLKTVGFSNERFGLVPKISSGVGCTTTALASLLSILGYTYTPSQVNDLLKANRGYLGCLMIWEAIPRAFPKVKSAIRSRIYSNSVVSASIKKGVPVLVEVLTTRTRHWCLYLGEQKMLDPWDGKIKPTSTYTPVGYTLFTR